MSETNNSNPGTPAPQGQPAVESAPASMDQLTGAQAKELVELAKAEGKEVEEVFQSKYGSKTPSAPKQESTQDMLKDAAKVAQEAIRRYKVKVDGQELEVDEDELKRGYSHQKAANKILQEGKAARKQAEEFINGLKTKEQLFSVLEKLGHNPRALAEEYLASQLQDELMDPREKELRDAKAKLKQIEDIEKKKLEEVQKARNEEMKAKYAQEYERDFMSALQSTGLPPTKAMVGEMAKYISRSAKIGFKMTAQEAASLVKEDIQKAQVSLIGNADGETLLKLLGDDVAAKILQARGSKVKTPESKLSTPSGQVPSERVRDKAPKRMSAKEWREYNRKK